ncbi:hypothetical protein SOVF_134490 [Spinacia oleracea]|uniref:Uncharacterized protein n=1 Tax=Spinacia oleracea TaxID=3562 RepID=A0A9R0IS30_SPIOL|nr:uncharacterized protein LOC110793001 [Spinacia oleracea]KNA11494.1 hypothetical protein SOVF_134490 [Spinacia oleracea]
MSGFSKLGITLTSVFSFLLFALLAEILYLFWRRRQQSHRNNSRIEPAGAATQAQLPTSAALPHSELFKIEGFYGPPSRVLFTIKEEEREELETELVTVLGEMKSGVSLGEHFGDFQFHDHSSEVIIMVDDDDEADFEVEPPFLTPCTSPPYYTPSPSPPRERS